MKLLKSVRMEYDKLNKDMDLFVQDKVVLGKILWQCFNFKRSWKIVVFFPIPCISICCM